MFVVRGTYSDEYYKSEDDTLREWIESDNHTLSKTEGYYAVQAPTGYHIINVAPAGFAMFSIEEEDGLSEYAETSVNISIKQAYYEKITLASLTMTPLTSEEFNALGVPEEDILDIPTYEREETSRYSDLRLSVVLFGMAIIMIGGVTAIISGN